MAEDKLSARIDELEALFRRYYKTFDRRRPIATDLDLLDHISVLEKARIFLLYPNHPFCQDKALKQSIGDQLKEFYRFPSRNE